MKIIKIVTISLLFICSNQSFAQTYESIYADGNSELRAKIDFNKSNNLPVLSGINTHYIIEISQLHTDQNELLVNECLNDQKIFEASFQSSNVLTIKGTGECTIESIKEYVKNFNASIENYSLNFEILE